MSNTQASGPGAPDAPRPPLEGEVGSSLVTMPQPLPIAPLSESVSTAVATQARAQVEARYLVAMKNPRSWLQVRSRLLESCKRPAFAAAARYRKPIGSGSVRGASIRFAEEALRCMGNAYIEIAVIFDDERQRIVRVTPTDLESNLSYPTDIILEKTVERRSPKPGAEILGSRQNAQGVTVYRVAATEDDLLTKQNAFISKAIRTQGLRLVPADIQDEAMDLCIATESSADAADPKAATKKIADAFDSIGVRPDDLVKFLGHPLDQTSPAEIARLREFWRAIEEGEATWLEVVEAGGKGESVKRGTEALKNAVKDRASRVTESAAPAAPAASPHTPAAPQAEPPAPAKSTPRSASPKPGAAAPVTGEAVPLVSAAQGKAVWLAMDAAKLKADTRREILEAVGAADTTTIPADRLDDVMAMIRDAK